jgi:hypothetical protein
MPVITRRQLRSLSHPNAVSEGGPEEDTLPRTMQESDVDNDPMDGSFAVLSSSKEDEEQESAWGEPESDASKDESDHEEIDHPDDDDDDDDDYEGNSHITNGYMPCKLRTQQHAPWQNALSWGKMGEHHHRSLPRRPRGLESIAGSRADCRTCCRCPLTSYSWYVRAGPILSPSVAERPISQILSELGPMDLVNLARTSKALRQVLMSRKSMWVWIAARRNAGAVMVPDPPEDMSEPAWALLLFGPAVCSVCSQLFSRIVSILSQFSVTAMLYEERSPGRFFPSPSPVHHL